MAFLLDPLESDINSLLAPLTSEATTKTATSSAVSTAMTASVSSLVATVSSIASTTSSSTLSKFYSSVQSTPITIATTSTTSSTLSQNTSVTSATTLATRITSSASSTLTTTSSASATESAPGPANPLNAAATTSSILEAPPAATSSATAASSISSTAQVSKAGIVVASIFAAAFLISILYLIFRFCPCVRRTFDKVRDRGCEERSYRQGIDGPAVPEKDFLSLSSAESVRAEMKRPFSFSMVTGQAPISKRITKPPVSPFDRCHGLGLGRVSMLRDPSLLRKSGFDVPPLPQSRPQTSAETRTPVLVDTTRRVDRSRWALPKPLQKTDQPIVEKQRVEEAHLGTHPALRDYHKSLHQPKPLPLRRDDSRPQLSIRIPQSVVTPRLSQIGVAIGTPTPASRVYNRVTD